MGDSSDTADTGSGNSHDESDFGYYCYKRKEVVMVDKTFFAEQLYDGHGHGSAATYSGYGYQPNSYSYGNSRVFLDQRDPDFQHYYWNVLGNNGITTDSD